MGTQHRGRGPELAKACAELQAQAAAIRDLTSRERLGVLGALGRAAVIRGDDVAVLAVREDELALAQLLGDQDAVDVAESNIASTLGNLGRHVEAAERGQALLARVDADGSGGNGNLPWVLGALFDALLALGRLGQARALLPSVFAVMPSSVALLRQNPASACHALSSVSLPNGRGGCLRGRFQPLALVLAAVFHSVTCPAKRSKGNRKTPRTLIPSNRVGAMRPSNSGGSI